jgi:hypothetical protein
MFDHKPVFLTFTDVGIEKSNAGNKKKVTNWYLDDPLINMSVSLSAYQIY